MNISRRGFLGALAALAAVPAKLPAAQQLPKEIVVPKEDPNDIVAFTKSLHAKVYVNGETKDRHLDNCSVHFIPEFEVHDSIYIEIRFLPKPTDNIRPFNLNV